MIYVQTQLTVVDNSGAKLAQCIKVLKGSFAKIGQIIIVSVKQLRKQNIKLKKGQIHKALITATKTPIRRTDGGYLQFDINTMIILDPSLIPIGSRILKPVAQELRYNKFYKAIAIATTVI